MDFIDGTPILKLGDEMARRGINPNGSIAKLAKRSELVHDFLILPVTGIRSCQMYESLEEVIVA